MPQSLTLKNELIEIVMSWGQGQSPSSEQRQSLVDWEQQSGQAAIWHLAEAQVLAAIEQRAHCLQLLVQALAQPSQAVGCFPLEGSWTNWIVPLWTLWLPLAQHMDQQQRLLGAPLIQGLLGGQGTGKTTLTRILQIILHLLGHRTAGLSIDDLYLTYDERCILKQQEPWLIWRGPPGTHDLNLGLQTLSAIKHAKAQDVIELPRFDKSLHGGLGDRTSPLTTLAPTITIFEGWFVGTQPLPDDRFGPTHADPSVGIQSPRPALPDPIVTERDRQFAQICNRRLKDYLPLWDFLDSLIVLRPENYQLSRQWRQEAEHQMKAQGKPGLSDADIENFVTYFWKALHPNLFITPLTQSPTTCLVIDIRPDHSPGELHCPDLDIQ